MAKISLARFGRVPFAAIKYIRRITTAETVTVFASLTLAGEERCLPFARPMRRNDDSIGDGDAIHMAREIGPPSQAMDRRASYGG
jgi:hypothetical protein